MDATQAATVSGSDQIQVLQAAGFAFATLDLINAGPMAQVSALQAIIAALAARLAILEARPEEVAHFVAQAKFPTLAIGARFNLALTGLAPAKAGDTLRAGEQVEAWPTGEVPAGIAFGRPVVTADNTVVIPCTAGLAVAASSAAVPFALAALR